MRQVTIDGVVYQARKSSGASCNGCAGISFSNAACRRLPVCGGATHNYIHWHKARVQPPAIPATPPLLPAPAACDIGPSLPSAWAGLAAAPARKTDPATSKGNRKVNKYEQAVLTSLIDPLHIDASAVGLNGKEIAATCQYPLNCITPRFAPLRRKGLIKDSGIKRDKQIVWVLA